MTDTRKAIHSGAGAAARRLRGHVGQKNFSMSSLADLTGYHPKTCQFIAGEDHYMCGKPGFPYCEEHRALTHVARGQAEESAA